VKINHGGIRGGGGGQPKSRKGSRTKMGKCGFVRKNTYSGSLCPPLNHRPVSTSQRASKKRNALGERRKGKTKTAKRPFEGGGLRSLVIEYRREPEKASLKTSNKIKEKNEVGKTEKVEKNGRRPQGGSTTTVFY